MTRPHKPFNLWVDRRSSHTTLLPKFKPFNYYGNQIAVGCAAR